MLMFHALFTPLVCAATVNTTLWAVLLTFVVVFSYWSVLYIALELEMPFGDDPNDLPLREMAVDLNLSLTKMLEPCACRVPLYQYTPGESSLKAIVVDLDMNLALTAAPKTVLQNWDTSKSTRPVSSCHAANGEAPRKVAVEVPPIPHQVTAVEHIASP